ncbi:hypothetical protein shim_36020 [Shimia sp. SK013]|uniref:hypothetical protein n=1 Tax=Shimia sp. SK013 TaxID=1389006 RepID=UPI0006B61523|nr:hypothetical protein [Shimia sp. SK013]KPA20104.1 hypothetical protein shim_36020 [Shimia sp. SK013]
MFKLWLRYRLWIFYSVFCGFAVIYGGREAMFSLPERYALGKIALIVIFVLFVGFSLYATKVENFFRSVRTINGFLWGRQIGVDLYISVFLSLAVIYMLEGSLLTLALWSVPVVIFANLAILPYILLNYTALVQLFLG